MSDQHIETAPVDDLAATLANESEPDTDSLEQGDDGTAPATAQERSGQDFLDEFGVQGGVWFAQGRSWSECIDLERAALKEQNADLKQRLSAVQPAGEDKPVDFNDDEDAPEKKKGFAGKINIVG